jgi:putative acetyltransferase
MIVQPETPDRYPAIRALHVEAFPSTSEADLVERLRLDDDARIALVAIEDDRVVGHIMLSRMDAPFRALGLAPVSVAADRRRRGIAARLIEAGLARARTAGWEGIFVLGDPAYYQRFGFSAAAAKNFDSRYAGPHLMLVALKNCDLPTGTGKIGYAPAFAALE